jgi:transcriptional regulator with XRE-family HTH domain
MKQSLAQFVSQRREKIGLSTSGLAKKCHLGVDVIERIESGEELFLATTVRQSLAKGLRCSLDEIKVLEKSFDNKISDISTVEALKEKILKGVKDLRCPLCGSPLKTRIAKMYDLEDNLMLHPKAVCTKCVFQIKD